MFFEVHVLPIKLTCCSLNKLGKIFITSCFKHLNEIVIGGVRAVPLLPQLQCSPPEGERGGEGREEGGHVLSMKEGHGKQHSRF